MREYFRYTLSNIFSMLGLSCYILMDTFFISLALGAKGLASLNLVLPGFNLITATGLMLGIGGATRYILYEKEDASLPSGSAFPMAIQSGLIFACVLACIGGFGAQWIAGVLGAKGALSAMSTDYIRTVLLFTPAFVCNDILNIYIKNDGNPTLAMTAMIAGSLVNIVLDYLFLFPMHMGMFGAALATGFSPIVGLLISSLHFLQKKNHFHYCPSSFSVPVLKSIFSLGFPKFVSEISAGIIIVVFNQILLDLAGHTAVAAYGIVANLSLVLIAVFSGLAEGVQPLYSRAKEQHKPQRLKQLWKHTLLFMSGIVAMGVLVVFLKT
ncbi:MAG: MATE family efflux transporter, partial [Erysipelotrichaceae bacterium]|nr:MATE family efflux transporter [Erysipelotrichaceae bacterium]